MNTDPAGSMATAAAWESLFRAQVAVMRRLTSDPAFAEISIREYDVLFNLSRCPSGWTRLNELNRHLLITQPSLSRLVERLEAKGLLTRRQAPDDHRGVELALTDKGRALQKTIGAAHVERIHELLSPVLEAGQLDELRRLCDTICARLGEARP